MPTPNPDESRDDFMSRCISELIETEDRSQDQAVAMCASFWTENQSKQVELLSPPINEQNRTAIDTQQAVIDQGHKFGKEDAGYVQPGPEVDVTCGLCTFYLGLDENGVAHCDVVNGGIEWFAHSELYINGEIQAAFNEANQAAIEDTATGEVEETMNKQRDEPKEYKTLPFIVTKIDEVRGIVEHTVAVMGNVDLGFDRIHTGAFTKTISERMHKIRVLDSHNTDSVMRVVGKPVMMKEIGKDQLPIAVKQAYPDADGALMATTQFLIDTPEGKGAFERIKAGAVDDYSIGYDPLDVDFTDEEIDGEKVTIRNLRTIKLWEYSPVVFAMNPATSTISAKDDKDTSNAADLSIADKDCACDSSVGVSENHEHLDDDSVVPLREKVIDLIVFTKAENLTARIRDVVMSFYKTYPDDARNSWWVKEIWDEHIVVEHDSINGSKLWKVPYTIDEKGIDFVSQTDWTEVELIYQSKTEGVELEKKIGRAISARNAARIQRAIDSAQSALNELENLLGVEPQEDDSEHTDDEEKSADTPIEETDIEEKAVSDVVQESNESSEQAGPDDEPPTSEDKRAILADIESALRELDKLSEVEGK